MNIEIILDKQISHKASFNSGPRIERVQHTRVDGGLIGVVEWWYEGGKLKTCTFRELNEVEVEEYRQQYEDQDAEAAYRAERYEPEAPVDFVAEAYEGARAFACGY